MHAHETHLSALSPRLALQRANAVSSSCYILRTACRFSYQIIVVFPEKKFDDYAGPSTHKDEQGAPNASSHVSFLPSVSPAHLLGGGGLGTIKSGGVRTTHSSAVCRTAVSVTGCRKKVASSPEANWYTVNRKCSTLCCRQAN